MLSIYYTPYLTALMCIFIADRAPDQHTAAVIIGAACMHAMRLLHLLLNISLELVHYFFYISRIVQPINQQHR